MSAVSLLAEALAAGVTLRLADGSPKVGGNPPPELLSRLRQHKSELIALLSGDACRYCGGHIDWSVPGARAFADDMAAHNTCWEQAEITRLLTAGGRAVASPDALADPAELALRGELE